MSSKVYVGNLPFVSTAEEVRAEFEKCGAVASVSIIKDRETGRPRGFGFVEYTTADAVNKAINDLNGREFGGRTLTVSEARERTQSGGSGNGGGYGRNR